VPLMAVAGRGVRDLHGDLSPSLPRADTVAVDLRWQVPLGIIAAVGGAIIVGAATASMGSWRTLVALGVLGTMLAVSRARPRRLLYLTVGWLLILGMVRRIIPQDADGKFDALLLVGPVAISLLAVKSVQLGALRHMTWLSWSVLALGVVTVVEALNPAQGSLLVGAAGLIFILVPQLAFWIGRGVADEDGFRKVLLVLAASAPPIALYGLAQSVGRFTPWDLAWLRSIASQYQALFIDQVPRAFGTFSAWAEYGTYIAIAIALWLMLGPRQVPRVLLTGIVAVLLVALLLESERTVVVTLGAALVVVGGIVLKVRLPIVVAVAAVALVALSQIASLIPDVSGAFPGSALIQHQIDGLANPSSSTLPIHTTLFWNGLNSAFSAPLGHGVGVITIASNKFGYSGQGTEQDASNAAVAFGLPGLVLYIAVVVFGFVAAYRKAVKRRDAITLAALAILVVTLSQWLNGGQYAVAILPWLALGWIDRSTSRELMPVAEAAAPEQSTGPAWDREPDHAAARKGRRKIGWRIAKYRVD
jgi:hypothetical protein